jgi:hypothetical protein
MGSGAALFSLATLFCASPHLLLPPNLSLHDETDSGSKFCFDNSTDVCGIEEQPHFLLFGVLAAALLSVGLGQTAVYTLGIPYLDDNVASRDSPLYFCKFIIPLPRSSSSPIQKITALKWL